MESSVEYPRRHRQEQEIEFYRMLFQLKRQEKVNLQASNLNLNSFYTKEKDDIEKINSLAQSLNIPCKISYEDSKEQYKIEVNLSSEIKINFRNSYRDGKTTIEIPGRKLGQGAFGKVVEVAYSVKEKDGNLIIKVNDTRVIKSVKCDLLAEQAWAKSIIREYNKSAMMYGLYHKRTHLTFTREGTSLSVNIVMPKANGSELEKLIYDNENVSTTNMQYKDSFKDAVLSKKLSIFRAATLNVADLHQINIIHLDLKPNNIFYDPTTDRGMLIDLGVSEFDGNTINERRGTPIYTDTTMFREPKTIISPAQDIYSLGMILGEFIIPGFGKQILRKGCEAVMGVSYDDIPELYRSGITEVVKNSDTWYKTARGLLEASEIDLPTEFKEELVRLVLQMIDDQPKNRPQLTEIISKLNRLIILSSLHENDKTKTLDLHKVNQLILSLDQLTDTKEHPSNLSKELLTQLSEQGKLEEVMQGVLLGKSLDELSNFSKNIVKASIGENVTKEIMDIVNKQIMTLESASPPFTIRKLEEEEISQLIEEIDKEFGFHQDSSLSDEEEEEFELDTDSETEPKKDEREKSPKNEPQVIKYHGLFYKKLEQTPSEERSDKQTYKKT